MAGARGNYLDIQIFLQPIPGSTPTGEDLRYDRIYDQIREARDEEDSSLSRGVWEKTLKEADWVSVEQLSGDALINRSKDLQIASWLVESWSHLDRFAGFVRGLTLFQKFSETFWETSYPKDPETKENLITWFFDLIHQLFVNIPFTNATIERTVYSYSDFMTAQHLETLSKRQGNPDDFLENQSKSAVILSAFLKSVSQTPTGELKTSLENVNQSLQALKNLVSLLSQKLGTNVPSSQKLVDIHGDIIRIITNELSKRSPAEPVIPEEGPSSTIISEFEEQPTTVSESPSAPLPSIPTGILKNRSDAYRELSKIAEYLQSIEPHSPIPQLLRRLVEWENKNLIDIFNQIAQTPQDLAVLMKLLGK